MCRRSRSILYASERLADLIRRCATQDIRAISRETAFMAEGSLQMECSGVSPCPLLSTITQLLQICDRVRTYAVGERSAKLGV